MVLLGVVLLVVMVLIIFGQPTMVMVICLLASRLFDRIALLDTRIVALPLELCVGGERQDPLHRLTARLEVNKGTEKMRRGRENES